MESTTRSRVGAVLTAAALATAGIVFFGSGSSPTPPLPPAAVASPVSPVPATLTVHVAGEVAAPGLVALPEGARIADALAAAGGTTATAALGTMNLASLVADGDRIHVPAEGDPQAETVQGVVADGRVRINEASPDELQQLPGVGPVLAQRIADHREAHGPFSAVEDLLDVPGIGEAKLASMREAIALP